MEVGHQIFGYFLNFPSSDKVNSVINKEDLYKLVKNLLENATKKVLYG